MAFEFLNTHLKNQEAKARYRSRTLVEEQNAREIIIKGEKYLNFSSNDYLGLNHHQQINAAFQEGLDKYGVSASASSLISGYQYPHQALEETICQWINKPRCLLYSSGFAANVGVLNALSKGECHFWLDKLSHASLIDGAMVDKTKVRRFLHNDTRQLSSMLDKAAKVSINNNVIVSEGVFSMDGDCADITSLSTIATQHNAYLYLDEAHSIGVIGEKGAGLAINHSVDIVMGTFGKAIATSGAFIGCSEQLHEYLVNFSRHYIYSTAISPALAWATKKSIELIQQEQWRRDKIKHLSGLLKNSLSSKLTLITSASSIHAIVVKDEAKAMNICQLLKNKNIWLTAIRPPTVPNNSSRLRVTITASHKEKDINYLANCLNEVMD